MSIHKRTRKNGHAWLVVITDQHGKQYSKTFQRKYDAEQWEIQQKNKLKGTTDRVELMRNSRKSLLELCSYWFENHSLKVKTNSSSRRDDQIIRNQIEPTIGSLSIEALRPKSIEKWFHELKESGLAPKTANNCLSLLCKILKDGVRWNWLEDNPAKDVKPFKLNNDEPSFWNKKETTIFLDQVRNKHRQLYPVFALALYAGLRKGEIRGLLWDCVNLERKSIVVKRIYCDAEKSIVSRTKGKKDRRIPINEILLKVLIKQKVGNEGGHVIKEFDWAHPHRLMKRLCREAGVTPIRFHDLRHTFASNLVMSGKPLYEVQKLLGHANYSTTEKYAHLSPDYLNGATDCLIFESEEKLAEVIPIGRLVRVSNDLD